MSNSNASENELDYNAVLPHWDHDEGLVAVTKWNFHSHFPNLLEIGYDTFCQEDRYPVIYCTDESVGEKLISVVRPFSI